MITKHHIKTVALSALLMLIPFSVHAQDNERALAKAVEEVVLMTDMNPKVVNEFIEEIYQKHGKKSAYLTSRIAKAYYQYYDNPTTKERNFGRREPDTAFVYINRAIAIDPKHPAPYILASEIVKYEPSYGERSERLKKAMEWLDRGIAANPADTSLYIASAGLLALTDANAAVEKLNSLKERNPSFAVQRQLGRLYWEIYNNGGTTPFKEIVEAYDKEDKNILTLGDLGSYMFSLYALCSSNLADWNKLYETGQYALGRFPDDYGLHMYYFYGCVRTNNWDTAITEYHKMEALAETPLLPIDHLRYGEALVGKKMYDEAIEKYQYILTLESATDDDKKKANSHIESAIIAKATDFQKMGEYDKAFAVYENFVNKRKANGKLTSYLLAMYARAYTELSEEQNGPEKVASLQKASSIYAQMGELFPDQKVAALNFQFITHVRLDPESEQGLAKPYAEQMITAILSKSDRSQDEPKLKNAYEYLSYYYFINSKYKDAVSYADKALEIDPSS